MTDRFFDTSAAVKHYLHEAGTAEVDNLLAGSSVQNFISALGMVELQSVFAREARVGRITAADFVLFRGRFLADIASGLWSILPLTMTEFQLAQQLIANHGLTRSLRTLDAVQLAVAVVQHARSSLDAFVCADSTLATAAAAEGLAVVNPEDS